MKPYQLAEMLNITSATIRRWAREEYTEFLSPDAQGGNRLHRFFNDHDARVIAWIASMRAKDETLANITATLRSAQADNWRTLPPLPGAATHEESVAMMPVEAVRARMEAVQEKLQTISQERDELRVRLSKMEMENEELRRKYYAVTEQLIELNKRLTDMLDDERKRSR